MAKKIMKKIAKEILPPFIHEALRKLFYRDKYKYNPTWHTIQDGNLKGRQILIDPKDGLWQKDMIEGIFDSFFFTYAENLNLRGKIVFDVGSHIGFHAMTFAELVGDEGMVYAFEPNIFNRERMEINLEQNPDLAKRIKIFDVAVSDTVGESELYFSRDVDKGTSSGCFISEAHTYYEKNAAYLNSFEITKVKTLPLDRIETLIGPDIRPDIIKIDVEGAESSVLEGARNVLAFYKPLLLMEIHSIYNMLRTCDILNSVNYKMTLLKEEPDGRCFLAASCR